MSSVCVLQRGHGGDWCLFGHRLCVSMISRRGDLYVLSSARVFRERRGSISSELIRCAQYFVIASCG